MDEGYFTREFDITPCKTLMLYQKEVGDVSCVVWDAALVLSKYIEFKCSTETKAWLKGSTVIELGAGVGCVGLTAACFGAHVIMTDLPAVLPLLQKNVDENRDIWNSDGGRINTTILDWGSNLSQMEIPNFILLADCVYYLESVDPLVKTLRFLSDSNTEVIISQEKRESEKQKNVWKTFQEQLGLYFNVTHIPENEQHPHYSSPDIVLLRARKKNSADF